MSIIKEYKGTRFWGGHLNIEMYNSANEVVADLETRQKTSGRWDSDSQHYGRFAGASKEECYTFLREGYQPVVDALKAKTKFTARGTGKRMQFHDDVAGFQPIIPNAIMGLPNAMINSRMTPIKTKVLDIYYEMTVPGYRSANDLIEAGKTLLGAILELEAQGYRFNLYCTQGYFSETKGTDMLCVKIKSANQPMDLKRMSFPIAHTGFFRGIGFEWVSKFPKGTYREGYGRSVSTEKDPQKIHEEWQKLFGKSAFFISGEKLCAASDKEAYIKEVLAK